MKKQMVMPNYSMKKKEIALLWMNMVGNKDFQDDSLIIFGRYPVPGQTKTRLIPNLGPASAAELQRQLTENIITTARAFTQGRGIDPDFHFEGDNTKKERIIMTTIKIKGMSCNHCVMATTKALNEVDGISNIRVDLEKGEAAFDEASPVDMNIVKEKIKKAGFEVV